MVRLVFLALAASVDFALAVLLVGVSGFLFEPGPESLHSGFWFATAYLAAVIACVIAPATGFILHAAGKHGPAQIMAWLPAAVALLVMAIPLFFVAR